MDLIEKAILSLVAQGAETIILTDGMSVDPDDLTPGAIRKTGARGVTYGVPVQPGNMFMLAYLGKTVLMGIPGCAMFCKTTVLDALVNGWLQIILNESNSLIVLLNIGG